MLNIFYNILFIRLLREYSSYPFDSQRLGFEVCMVILPRINPTFDVVELLQVCKALELILLYRSEVVDDTPCVNNQK